jgi:hypothetical protein
MKPVERSEILDLGKYEEVRDHFRRRVIAEKRERRVALGPNMTVLFENHDTVLFQIQEMLRTERITREDAILHEIETYNELVPGHHELSATVFVEYPDAAERERMLAALAGLESRFYVEVGSTRVPVVGDHRNDRRDRTLAVHYAKFPLGEALAKAIVDGSAPVAIGVDHSAYQAVMQLGEPTLASLRRDLAGDAASVETTINRT